MIEIKYEDISDCILMSILFEEEEVCISPKWNLEIDENDYYIINNLRDKNRIEIVPFNKATHKVSCLFEEENLSLDEQEDYNKIFNRFEDKFKRFIKEYIEKKSDLQFNEEGVFC